MVACRVVPLYLILCFKLSFRAFLAHLLCLSFSCDVVSDTCITTLGHVARMALFILLSRYPIMLVCLMWPRNTIFEVAGVSLSLWQNAGETTAFLNFSGVLIPHLCLRMEIRNKGSYTNTILVGAVMNAL